MKKLWLTLAVASLVAILGGSLSALAQSKRGELVVKVSFEFKVGDTTFPPGSYKIEHRTTNASSLVISPETGSGNTTVPVITRLARRNQAPQEAEANIVFDKVGEQHFLSEVWMSGQDGFLLRSTGEEHQHDVLRVGG